MGRKVRTDVRPEAKEASRFGFLAHLLFSFFPFLPFLLPPRHSSNPLTPQLPVCVSRIHINFRSPVRERNDMFCAGV